MEWEAEPLDPEIQEAAVHIPHINNNQYAALADDDKKMKMSKKTTTKAQKWGGKRKNRVG